MKTKTGKTLVEAIRSNKPFTHPDYYSEGDKYKWVQYNSETNDFEWADEFGVLSGNCFGDLSQLCEKQHSKHFEYIEEV